MAGNGLDHLADRTVRDDVHAAKRGGQRGRDIFHFGDTCDLNIWPVCLRLGMSYCLAARPLWMADEKDRHYAASVSLAVVGICTTDRRVVYVRLADIGSISI